MNVTIYTYAFSPWPDETWNLDPAVYKLFRFIGARVEQQFTETEFEAFRSGLSHHGLTLREVDRWPYHTPEPVY